MLHDSFSKFTWVNYLCTACLVLVLMKLITEIIISCSVICEHAAPYTIEYPCHISFYHFSMKNLFMWHSSELSVPDCLSTTWSAVAEVTLCFVLLLQADLYLISFQLSFIWFKLNLGDFGLKIFWWNAEVSCKIKPEIKCFRSSLVL